LKTNSGITSYKFPFFTGDEDIDVKAQGFYLLLYSIALRTLLLSPLNILITLRS